MISKKAISIFVITVLVFISGCAFNKPRGPVFTQYKNVNKQRALIYVYRPLGEQYGWDRTYYLNGDDGAITDLKHGGYFPFEVKPGKVILVADVNVSLRTMILLDAYLIEKLTRKGAAVLEFEAKAGDVYYVRFKPITHPFNFEPTLALVTKDESKNELIKCKLIINDTK